MSTRTRRDPTPPLAVWIVVLLCLAAAGLLRIATTIGLAPSGVTLSAPPLGLMIVLAGGVGAAVLAPFAVLTLILR